MQATRHPLSWDRQLPAGSLFSSRHKKSRLEAGGPRKTVFAASWGLRRSPSDFADFGAGILSPRNKKPGSRGARAEYVNLSGYSAEYRRKRRKNQAEFLSHIGSKLDVRAL